jgi:hypothetical protein
MFEPYKQVQQPEPTTRQALKEIVDRAHKVRQVAYLFVNNRLEGNAPGTIEGVIGT